MSGATKSSSTLLVYEEQKPHLPHKLTRMGGFHYPRFFKIILCIEVLLHALKGEETLLLFLTPYFILPSWDGNVPAESIALSL